MRANAAKALGFLAFGCIWHNWFWFLMIFVFLYFVLSLLWLVLFKLKVCLQGLQRVEEKHNDPEVLLCYLESDAQNISKPERRQRQGSFGGVGVPQLHCFPHLRPTDIGPYRTQMLMEATYGVKGKKCSCKCNQCNRFQPFWGENHSIFWKVWHPHPGHVNRTALCKPKDVIRSNVKCDNEMRCPTKQRCTDLIIENLWTSAWVQEVWTRRQERSPSILRTRFHWLRQSLLQCFLAGWGKQFWNHFLP